MPYLTSNKDVNEQDGFSTALMIGATVLAGAAAVGAFQHQKSLKAMTKKYTAEDVAQKLYKSQSPDIKSLYGLDEHISPRTFDMTENGNLLPRRYQAGKTFTGKNILRRTNGNFAQNTITNFLDKDLRAFNKHAKMIAKTPDDVYSKSRLFLYDELERSSRGLNTNTHELAGLVDNIYGAKAHADRRGIDGIQGMADDVEFTKAIWNKKYPTPETPVTKKTSAPDVNFVMGKASPLMTDKEIQRQKFGKKLNGAIKAVPLGLPENSSTN